MNVGTLIKGVYEGTVVIPDFQRSFVWEPEDVRELLVSVLGAYFIGSMLVLEHFRGESPFQLRLVEGVERVNKKADISSIATIVLDGQQRTTALFYALYEPDLPLKNRKSPYKFYLDIEKALQEDWNAAVVATSVSDTKKMNMIGQNRSIIPFSLLREFGRLFATFADHPKVNNIVELSNNFMNHEVHMVPLPKDTNLEKIVETFERINRTGEPLSVFELLTAKLYKHGIKLRDLLESSKEKYTFLEVVNPEFVLKTIALTRGREPKRRDILELQPNNFVQDWERAAQSLDAAYKRVTDVRDGYGVLDFKGWAPYTTMLVPLAALLDLMKDRNLQSAKNYDKVDSWYWASVFHNRYDQAVDTTSASDFNLLEQWLTDDDKTPAFMGDLDLGMIDLDVDRPTSATYRGVVSLIVLAGALDFKTGQPPQFGIEKVQDDHIFPKSLGYNSRFVNLVTNRTLISTNAEKSNKPPREYFGERLRDHGEAKLKEILASHLIPNDSLDLLLRDDLEHFSQRRKQTVVDVLRRKIAVLDR